MKHALKPAGMALFAGILLFATASSQAEVEDPDAWIGYRGSLMNSIKYHFKAARAIAKGSPALKLERHLLAHARSLQNTADLIVEVFPEGSDFGDTEALETVWEDREGFQAAAETYADAIDALVEAAAAGDRNAVGEALKQTGQGCKGCHDEYRAE